MALAQRGSDQGSSSPQVEHQRARQIQTSLTPCPFKKWNFYFPDIGESVVLWDSFVIRCIFHP